MKTVTVKSLDGGSTRVRIQEHRFPLNQPVKDVPDAIAKQLSEMPGVKARIEDQKADADSPRRK